MASVGPSRCVVDVLHIGGTKLSDIKLVSLVLVKLCSQLVR
jgi:hypothetical protein